MSSDPYQTLGISPTATFDEARIAYLKHVRVLHPDRFDPVTQKVEWELANDMLREVNAAWKAIETGTALTSTQKADPPLQKNQPPFARPQSPFSGPPVSVAGPQSDAVYNPGEPITYSRAIGEVGPYSEQAIACLGLVIAGLLLIFSGMAPLFFVLAIIFGYTAKASIRKNQYQGGWIATLGLWMGCLGLIGAGIVHLLSIHPQTSPPPPALTGDNEQTEQLNDELAQLDNQEKQQVAFIENDLDSILALLKLENTELQTKIAKQTKVLAGLNDQYNSLKMEMDGSDGVRAAVDGARLEQLNNQMTEIAGQTSRIEAELKNDKATLNEQLALLQKPRSEQLSRLESQISLRFDERRRVIKQKLMQLQVGISK